jgi:hypothetical protein
MGLMFGLKRIAKRWREAFVAGATNTGNVTATVGNKLVLNWHGTPTQRDDALRMFPVIRDKSMPGAELGSCADAIIASIHDGGMSPDEVGSNIQTIAMLWRVFTTQLDEGTYGDLIAHTNMHATFELHEQPNDQFKITWKISVTRGRPTNEREEKSTQPWAKEYAQNLYGAFVAKPNPGDITALSLRIPTVLHAAYQNKIVLQRELISFAALASIAKPESGLQPVLLAYVKLVVDKMAKRGLQMSEDQLAKAAFDDVEAMIAQPFKWARQWLSEFGDDPHEDYILFADHCMRLLQAYKHGIEQTQPR